MLDSTALNGNGVKDYDSQIKCIINEKRDMRKWPVNETEVLIIFPDHYAIATKRQVYVPRKLTCLKK